MIRRQLRRLLRTRTRVSAVVVVPAALAAVQLAAMLLLGPRDLAWVAVGMVLAAAFGAAAVLWMLQMHDSTTADAAAANALQARYVRADAYNQLADVIRASMPTPPPVQTDAAAEVVTLTDHVVRLAMQHQTMATALQAIYDRAADIAARGVDDTLPLIAVQAGTALAHAGAPVPPGSLISRHVTPSPWPPPEGAIPGAPASPAPGGGS